MKRTPEQIIIWNPRRPTYEPPELTLVGDAHRVVLGFPGGGWDGPYGMSEPEFEFEEDGQV
jgi:hypothetical protein